MEITNEAQILINKLLKSNDVDTLKVTLQKSCCSSSLAFNMIRKEEKDETITINNVQVLINEETINRAKTITITVKDGELLLKDSASCSCY